MGTIPTPAAAGHKSLECSLREFFRSSSRCPSSKEKVAAHDETAPNTRGGEGWLACASRSTESRSKRVHRLKSKMRHPGFITCLFFALVSSVFAQVAPVVTITTSFLPDATLGQNYSIGLTATGGSPPYTWSILSGSLPPNMNLATNGTISGSPTSGGFYSFTVSAVDTKTNRATKALSIFVITPLTINSPSPMPVATVGVAYSVNLTASGGFPPYTFTVQGSLPPGINLSSSGSISGIPNTAGNYSFMVTAIDNPNSGTAPAGSDRLAALSTPDNSGSKNLSITVAPALIFTTASPLPDGSVGVVYSQKIVASGGTPPYSFFTSSTLPAGLTLGTDGTLSGTPTATGTSTFTVSVSDSNQVTSSKPYQLTIGKAAPSLSVSPISLTFSALFGGDSPSAQQLDILSTLPQPSTFKITTDAGLLSSPPPTWLTVKPVNGTAPAKVVVTADQGTMSPGTYNARINVADAGGNVTSVGVTLTIKDVTAQLAVVPGVLHVSTLSQTPGTFNQTLVVSNTGGHAPLTFNTSLGNDANFITSVTPSTGQIPRNSPVLVTVKVSTQGLKQGAYRQTVHFTSANGNIDIPVPLFVASTGPILGVNVTGLRFQARSGNGFSNPQTVKVLNVGDPATTLNWTADFLSGSGLFNLGSTSGTATLSNPGSLTITPSQTALQGAAGGYYAVLRITSSQAKNSPQYVILVLDLAAATSLPLPDPSPAGIFFVAVANGAQPATQTVTINTSSSSAAAFQAATLTSDGGTWLSVSPSTGTSSSQTPGQVKVSINTAGLTPGIYTGEVSFSMSGVVRTVNITLVVTPAGSSFATPVAEATTPQAGCTASKLALTENGLVNNFAVPASWPAPLIVQLNDDCGAGVVNGSVVANFSNGDAPLMLKGDGQNGTYSASWQPVNNTNQMTVTLRGTSGTLQPATMLLTGTIAANQAPVLFANGTVDPFYRVGGGALAPGTIVEIYGMGLASSTTSPSTLPLPPTFNGTFVTVGGLQAPLDFLSSGQLDAVIPFELTPNQQYSILVSANNAFTLPDLIDIVPVQPGVAGYTDGHILAQHGLDYSLVNAASPAKPGEVLIIYLLGLGATNPSVPSGNAAPGVPPLAQTATPVTMTVGGMDAPVAFAGLTPGLAGLFQIDFFVPTTAPSGDLDVVVTQNSIPSNTLKLPVSK